MKEKIKYQEYWNHLLNQEQQKCNELVSNIFGYYSVQLGLTSLESLKNNRILNKFYTESYLNLKSNLICYPENLPFTPDSLDLLILPHTLNICDNPNAVLREAFRVLRPEGKLIIFGINPLSILNFQIKLNSKKISNLKTNKIVNHWQLIYWLKILGFEVKKTEFLSFHLAKNKVEKDYYLKKKNYLEKLVNFFLPMFGNIYCIQATKKVYGLSLLKPKWQKTNFIADIISNPMPSRKNNIDE